MVSKEKYIEQLTNKRLGIVKNYPKIQITRKKDGVEFGFEGTLYIKDL